MVQAHSLPWSHGISGADLSFLAGGIEFLSEDDRHYAHLLVPAVMVSRGRDGLQASRRARVGTQTGGCLVLSFKRWNLCDSYQFGFCGYGIGLASS